jgi:NDP-sugar pyrophosphorylase family protein
MRKRISITIREELLRKLDSTVDNTKIRNRSHAIEGILEEKFAGPAVDVLVLAGDPACMARIGGKPLLAHTLALLKNQGFERVVIGTLSPTAGQVEEYFGNGSKLGLNLKYFEQKERVGTAATLRKAKNALTTDVFLLVYADNFFNFNLPELVTFHRQTGGAATMALTTVRTPTKFGVVELQGKQIVGFNEKPEKSDSYLVSTGVFVFDASKAFSAIQEKARSLERDVFPGLIAANKLAGCVVSGKWIPIEGEKDAQAVSKEFF